MSLKNKWTLPSHKSYLDTKLTNAYRGEGKINFSWFGRDNMNNLKLFMITTKNCEVEVQCYVL